MQISCKGQSTMASLGASGNEPESTTLFLLPPRHSHNTWKLDPGKQDFWNSKPLLGTPKFKTDSLDFHLHKTDSVK